MTQAARKRAFDPRSLAAVGWEIARAAIYVATARTNRREPQPMAPPLERFRHGQAIEQYDGAVAEAGGMGHRVIDACLLDTLRERGLLGDLEEDGGKAALLRHSAGLWLRGLFHDSGLMRSVTLRLEGPQSGGDPTGAAAFERGYAASRALAVYQAAMVAMEKREIDTSARRRSQGKASVDERHGRRAAHAVREIACWDRIPSGFSAAEVRSAFDRLVSVMDWLGNAVETSEF